MDVEGLSALVLELLAGLDRCDVADADERACAVAACRSLAVRIGALPKAAASAPPRAVGYSPLEPLSRLAQSGRRSISGPALALGALRRVVLLQTAAEGVADGLRKHFAGEGMLIVPARSANEVAQALRDLAPEVDVVLFDWPSEKLLACAETARTSFVALVAATDVPAVEAKERLLSSHPVLADAVVVAGDGTDPTPAIADALQGVLARRKRLSGSSDGNRVLVRSGSGNALTAGAASAPQPHHKPPAKTFLICDDNDTNVLFAEYLLRKSVPDCAIDLCSDGVDAVQECQLRKYDLIFLDLHMPRLEGIEACERIKAGMLNCSTPIICMTSDTGLHVKIDVRAAGMVEVLVKPFSDAAFARVVNTWCPLATANAAVNAGAAAAATTAASATEPPVLNRAVLNPIESAFRQRLLASWKRSFPAILKGLGAATEAKDLRVIAGLAHGLLGSSAQVGAVAVTDLARELQNDASLATPVTLARLQRLFNETVTECDLAFDTDVAMQRGQ